MTDFTTTYLTRPNERSAVFWYPCNVLCIQPVRLDPPLKCYFLHQERNSSRLGQTGFHHQIEYSSLQYLDWFL